MKKSAPYIIVLLFMALVMLPARGLNPLLIISQEAKNTFKSGADTIKTETAATQDTVKRGALTADTTGMKRGANIIANDVTDTTDATDATDGTPGDGSDDAPQDSASLAARAKFLADSVAIDSLMQIYRALGLWEPDSTVLFELDSTLTSYYDSLQMSLPDSSDIKRAKRRIAKEIRDSIRISTPRVLATFALPDSLYYRRILKWTAETKFNEITPESIDTLYQEKFNDYPFLRKDLDAVYLGTVGSAAMAANFFKREEAEHFPQFSPYIIYSYTPSNAPQYNTKTPYTELAYWGTPFALRAREETEVHVLSTQNITPALNFTLEYTKFGTNGTLQKEVTDNRTFRGAVNHLGKRYLMNAGFILQNVRKNENGGLIDPMWIRDTIVDPKEISVNLTSASNTLRRFQAYLTHSLAIPMNFFRKDADSLALGEGTMAFIGHNLEYWEYKKNYIDAIGQGESTARNYYNNVFNIDANASSDSTAMRSIGNRLFIKLQPFAPDAFISKINAGVGHLWRSYYFFEPEFYLSGPGHRIRNNFYLYAGASGMFRKYFSWEADGKYDFAGSNINDFTLGGGVRLSLYPFRDGIHIGAKGRITRKEPNTFYKKIHFNHHSWDNDFSKTTRTQFEASIEVPLINLKANASYALLDKYIYLDETSNAVQKDGNISVFSASVEENLKFWILHLDNRALYQISTDSEAIPLPRFTLNLRWYLEFPLVKNALDVQVGANAIYHTAYHIPGYAPDLGMFYNQREEKMGGDPYVDAFINGQWQKVCVFVKYTNAFLHKGTTDFFSACGYLRPAHGFKIGVFWPF